MEIPKLWDLDTQVCVIGRHEWSVARLIYLSKNLEIFDAPLNALNVWKKYNVTMREFVAHIKLVQEASLEYPIILDEDGELMDGSHRIMRAILEGHKTIKAVRFNINPQPCRILEN